MCKGVKKELIKKILIDIFSDTIIINNNINEDDKLMMNDWIQY
jgi:hypothetical protein